MLAERTAANFTNFRIYQEDASCLAFLHFSFHFFTSLKDIHKATISATGTAKNIHNDLLGKISGNK